jgi:surfeit locus 1 family protein
VTLPDDPEGMGGPAHAAPGRRRGALDSDADGANAGRRWGRRSPAFLGIAGTVAVLFFALFVALGTWQVKRRVWKLELIARVEERVHAPPAAAPGPAQWPYVTAATDEYRHVALSGTFLDRSQTLVQAVTDLGAGYWVVTPLRLADGSIVLVNRGFVAADDRDRVQPGTTAAQQPATSQPEITGGPIAAGQQASPSQPAATREPAATLPSAAMARVIGLLRMTEPHGGFLRHNDPAANRWYSRDVQAIAAARGLRNVAPYFIDVEAAAGDAFAGRATSGERGASTAPAPASRGSAALVANGHIVAPVAGLTVITFHNSHLVYAITWYTLALMVAGAIWLGFRNETRA